MINHMRHSIIVFFVCVFVCLGFNAQETSSVLFWNIENLFDIYDDPDKDDDSFTPAGDYHWTYSRYRSKLDALARVIVAADEESAPILVGLCEVENDSVLKDLTFHSTLRPIGYRYVMTDSPDKRGIDVALLYRKSYFRLIASESIPVSLSPYSRSATRDILHVTGIVENMDTLDVYVCHWPSRIGGVEETEPLRMRAALTLRKSVDSIFMTRRKPYVIIMGDLNEGPNDEAVRKGLMAHRLTEGRRLDDRELVTLMEGVEQGSYKYQGLWDTYDQFVVSASLMNDLGCTNMDGIEVFAPSFLLEDDDDYGGVKPFRTYNGRRYKGGYSDHLPILLKLSF